MLSRLVTRSPPKVSAYRRAVSTSARGLSAVLQQKPDDVVITFAKRTAMGKVKKGQFKDTPVDELLHGLFKVFYIQS
jgi:acetyl-CoA acyltransferase 1